MAMFAVGHFFWIDWRNQSQANHLLDDYVGGDDDIVMAGSYGLELANLFLPRAS
jgi:hypothetical protein